MACRHVFGDPACSNDNNQKYIKALKKADEANLELVEQASKFEQLEREREARVQELYGRTPDPDRYEIEVAEEYGTSLLLAVKYPSCSKCAYEGTKIMVFDQVKMKEVLFWTKLDPHFRGETEVSKKEAPSPAARFPASPIGMKRAIQFAKMIGGVT